MDIVPLPLERLAGERIAMRKGLARVSAGGPLRLVPAGRFSVAFCAACAAPIEFGAVWRGEEAFCSVECSLGGDRPA